MTIATLMEVAQDNMPAIETVVPSQRSQHDDIITVVILGEDYYISKEQFASL